MSHPAPRNVSMNYMALKMTKKSKGLKTTKETITLSEKILKLLSEYKESYLLRLLNKEEHRELDKERGTLRSGKYLDAAFRNTFHGNHMGPLSTIFDHVDVPEREWNKTEYKHLKFSRSKSSRITAVICTEENGPKSKALNVYSDFDRKLDNLRFNMVHIIWICMPSIKIKKKTER